MDQTTAMPSSVSACTMRHKSCRLTGSTPTPGSSSSSTSGRAISAQASPNFCFMRPEKLAGQALGEGPKPREVQQLGKQIGIAIRIHAAQLAYRRMFSITDRSSYRPEALRHIAAGDVDGVVVLDHVKASQGDCDRRSGTSRPVSIRISVVLPGAVRADQTGQPPIVDVRAQAPQGLHLAEMLVHAFDDDGSGIGARACRRGGHGGACLHLNAPPRAGREAGLASTSIVTGMPWRKAASLSASSMTMRRRYTRSVRKSVVSTVLGVDSARGEIEADLAAIDLFPGIAPDVHHGARCDAAQIPFAHEARTYTGLSRLRP